jgi:hypothetical protein
VTAPIDSSTPATVGYIQPLIPAETDVQIRLLAVCREARLLRRLLRLCRESTTINSSIATPMHESGVAHVS